MRRKPLRRSRSNRWSGHASRNRCQPVPRKQKARALLEAVLRAQGEGRDELTLKELLAAVGAPRSTAQAFIDAGLLPVSTRDLAFQEEYGFEEFTRTIRLNADQQRVLDSLAAALAARQPHTFLLQGVTGSGKTQVYIEAIKRCLASGRSAIVLVPEISLTPQTVRRFRAHFADEVMTVHSRMTPSERTEVWRRAARGSCKIVIGPRSAIFAPLKNLGLIVVDEEHESSYKQFDASRGITRGISRSSGALTRVPLSFSGLRRLPSSRTRTRCRGNTRCLSCQPGSTMSRSLP